MPDTRLILHVKGTEADTAELPMEEVRAGLSQGKITHSQLIWSPADNAWKQAREWPELSPVESLILHVKGTEAETRYVPKNEVRAAISQGKITHSQLIWSPAESSWKQVREIPDLLPSQKLAPAPASTPEEIIPESPAGPVARAAAAVVAKPQIRTPVAIPVTPSAATSAPLAPKPKVATASVPQIKVATGLVPHIKVAVSTGAPQVKVATATPQIKAMAASPVAAKPQISAAGAPMVRAAAGSGRSTGSLEVNEEDSLPLFKWIFIGLGVFIVLVVGANFFLVDQPLVSKFGRSSYSAVPVYAHFGAFMQPNVMVIHIPASAQITAKNLPDVLITLARDTPVNPITQGPFARVAITSGWTAQYSFSGSSWNQLADLDQETEDQRKEFLMAQMDDAGGQSLMPESTMNEEAQQTKRDQAWKAFVAHFTTQR